MSNFLNKITLIIGIAAVLIVIGAAAFYFGGKAPLATDNIPGSGQFPISDTRGGGASPSAPGGEPTQAAAAGSVQNADNSVLTIDQINRLTIGTLIKLTDDAGSSLAPAEGKTIRYHKNIPDALGHLFERNADGSNPETKNSNFTIPQVLKVVWAPGAAKAVVFYNLSGIVKKILIDYKSTSTPKTSFLPDSVSDVAFSPDAKSMVFINDLGDTRNIFIASSDFKNQKKILNNIVPDLELSWPGTSLLAAKTRSSYASLGYLYVFSATGANFAKIAEGFGLDAAWNGDGSIVLVSSVTGVGEILPIRIIDIKTSEKKESIVKTFAEKCVFRKTIKTAAYCSVPVAPQTFKYPDAWWQGITSLKDNFVVIDALTGNSFDFIPTSSDIIRPQILSDDSFLVFQDKTTGFLWSIKLK